MTEDLSVFLADFGKDVSGPGGLAFKGILDQPDEIFVAGEMSQISNEALLTFATADAPDLARGDELTIDSKDYVLRQAPLKIGDGSFSKVLLSDPEDG